jgi:plasmid replication initiation protein
MEKLELVVKSNGLIKASYSLGLVEQRLILMAIVQGREKQVGITADTLLTIRAEDYAVMFGVARQTAYQALSEAMAVLFERQVTFYDVHPETRKPRKNITRWVSKIAYVEGEGLIQLIFAPDIVPEITRLEENFTSYELEQVAGLSSAYAVRLYELLIQWRTAGKTPLFKLDEFRNQLGVEVGGYKQMGHFKSRILDLAVNQINEHTDIDVQYEQIKAGRIIAGFIFKFKQKPKPKTTPSLKNQMIEMTDEFVAKHAQIGESWEQARTRLRREAQSGKFSMSPTD